MFTGLIEETGKVVKIVRSSGGARLTVRSALEELRIGESIAVNGACQTVSSTTGDRFSCDVLPETLRVTNLGLLTPGSTVNLERALRSGDRWGGHMVNGHVDGIGTIKSITGNPRRLEIRSAPEILAYLVPKGSVAVDGISLTVGPDPGKDRFEVFIIPHTWEKTNLRSAAPGRKVNIEVDIVAKYVNKFIQR
ncbi:MAG: riboflavin synthase [Candidatus Krumholzibacteriota bacterium]|nr:riboflavin synthase [Candidatus Krumholzibacteriota bacterium]